jgi:hypothetical protein
VTEWSDPRAVAYCGLICAGCPGLSEGCVGCRAGGGDDPCQVRDCCVEHGYQGCWECSQVPCDRGPFGRAEFVGMCTGLIQMVQAQSLEGMLTRVRQRLGDVIDYGALSGLAAEDVRALLDAD